MSLSSFQTCSPFLFQTEFHGVKAVFFERSTRKCANDNDPVGNYSWEVCSDTKISKVVFLPSLSHTHLLTHTKNTHTCTHQNTHTHTKTHEHLLADKLTCTHHDLLCHLKLVYLVTYQEIIYFFNTDKTVLYNTCRFSH